VIKKLWRYLKPFRNNTGTWRTDGRTEGQTRNKVRHVVRDSCRRLDVCRVKVIGRSYKNFLYANRKRIKVFISWKTYSKETIGIGPRNAYTLSQKGCHFYICNNFGRCRPILIIILSLLYSQNVLLRKVVLKRPPRLKSAFTNVIAKIEVAPILRHVVETRISHCANKLIWAAPPVRFWRCQDNRTTIVNNRFRVSHSVYTWCCGSRNPDGGA